MGCACGSASREPPHGHEEELVEEIELETGAWFGEKCLFEEERIRTATGIAAMESELAVLQASEYHRIITKFPPLLEQHRRIQRDIIHKRVTLSDLEYAPTPVM